MTPPALAAPSFATDERPHATSTVGLTTAPLWAVVLAGGWGIRLRPLTRLICGDERPKQYVTLTGSRSLLQHTLDRAALRIPAEHTVVVSLESHASYLAAAMPGHAASVLLQPIDRGTASGVLLPAYWIHGRAPDATVVIFPSDHLVVEADVFMDQVVAAAAFVEEQPNRIVLLGARPTDAETEYGWIEPGSMLGFAGDEPVRAVRRFIEKPSPDVARECLAAGACWNTFVFVAKVSALAKAARECVPEIHSRLERMVHSLGRHTSPQAVRRIGASLPIGNFSRDVLEHVAPMLAVMALRGVTWCDWGSPRRVVASLERLGIRPPWLDHLPGPDNAGSGR
jgi:mannose-1-phosphate guanylyltransferase